MPDTRPTTMSQVAPYPVTLDWLVAHTAYRPGWSVALADLERDPATTHAGSAAGLTLIVTTQGLDAYHPDRGATYRVRHYFPVPAATYGARSWRRWLFDRLLDVERHEAMEFFAVDGKRPYAPVHAPGVDPYVVHDYATDLERRTSFRGDVKPDPDATPSIEDARHLAAVANDATVREAWDGLADVLGPRAGSDTAADQPAAVVPHPFTLTAGATYWDDDSPCSACGRVMADPRHHDADGPLGALHAFITTDGSHLCRRCHLTASQGNHGTGS